MADIRVAVIGANGRMGREASAAVDAAGGMELVATLGSGDDVTTLRAEDVDVAVELTVPEATADNVEALVAQGIHAVVGTTGWTSERLEVLRESLGKTPATGVLIAPNFSLSAVLAMRFAELAAPHFDSAEVIEIHHPRKLDAPSGTAVHTAQRIARSRAAVGLGAVPDATEHDPHDSRGAVIEGIHVHAVRLPGRVAHEEIQFGSPGEALTIRTDSFDRSSFMPGIVRAVRLIGDRPGLTIGLEHYLDL